MTAPPLETDEVHAYGTTTEAWCKKHKVISKARDPEGVERDALQHIQDCLACNGSVRISRWLYRVQA
jgi:hypothetical protein